LKLQAFYLFSALYFIIVVVLINREEKIGTLQRDELNNKPSNRFNLRTMFVKDSAVSLKLFGILQLI